MNNQEARQIMQTTFIASGIFPSANIGLDNQEFTPPVGTTSWGRLSVQFNTGTQETLGIKTNRKFTMKGILFIQVFTINDDATNNNDSLVQQSLDVFDGESFDGLYFLNGSIRTVGNGEKWYQQNAVLEFTYHEIK